MPRSAASAGSARSASPGVAVALVGSLNRNARPERLRASYAERWGDRWYLVNAKGGTIGDIPVYEHVTDIPAEITLAVVNVGMKLVTKTVEECGKHGVPYVLIFTAGFSEVGEAGAALEREVGEVARRYGIRVFGPNTNTNAFEVLPEPTRRRGGRIGLVTQSGHQGRPLVQGTEFGVAFSRWVPTGNELDLEAADFIEYFAYDGDTDVIAGYFEGFKDPAKLRRALEAANAQGKPVVALKMGSTEAGTRMASSHTGHLAGLVVDDDERRVLWREQMVCELIADGWDCRRRITERAHGCTCKPIPRLSRIDSISQNATFGSTGAVSVSVACAFMSPLL